MPAMPNRTCLVVLIFVLVAAQADAQTSAPDRPGFRLDFPAFDAPYNTTNGGRAPSMQQSLALGIDFYEASHGLIQRAWHGRRWPTVLSITAWDFFTSGVVPLPGADPWVHEEFHRAVLGRRAISSFNDVYSFNPTKPGLYVSRVTDEDLIRLKRDHPQELVRASAAGIEGDYLLVQGLERNGFFGRSSGWHLPIYLGAKLVSIGYIWSAHLDRVNADTDQLNQMERSDISVRDFTGHDVAAWVYDLHRPDEPYAARGVHEGGLGIDRYIKPSDLTPDEMRYVEQQGWLSLINLIDPFLLRPRGFTVTNPVNDKSVQISARGGHLLTPFGYTIDADVVLQQGLVGLALEVHTYVSHNKTLPGVDLSLVEYPIGKSIVASPRLALWLQPANQRFDAVSSTGGGLLGCRFDWRVRHGMGLYVDLEGKSAGWVAGSEYLGATGTVKLGMTIQVR